MTANEKFLTQRQRYQAVTLPQDFSDEEMARDWTLSEADKREINRYRTNSRLFIAIQLCAVRLYGRFLVEVNDLSPRIVSYLNSQLKLPPSLTINTPDRPMHPMNLPAPLKARCLGKTRDIFHPSTGPVVRLRVCFHRY